MRIAQEMNAPPTLTTGIETEDHVKTHSDNKALPTKNTKMIGTKITRRIKPSFPIPLNPFSWRRLSSSNPIIAQASARMMNEVERILHEKDLPDTQTVMSAFYEMLHSWKQDTTAHLVANIIRPDTYQECLKRLLERQKA